MKIQKEIKNIHRDTGEKKGKMCTKKREREKEMWRDGGQRDKEMVGQMRGR